MPKEEAGFAGYYLQGRVVRIVAVWIFPLLALSVIAILQAFVPLPPPITWAISIVLLTALVFRKRLEATVDKKVYSWRTGRNSEWEVREALAQHLGDSFYLLNDVVLPNRGGNIDHIVVGPSGIHVIETKGVIGKIDATGDKLLHNGYPRRDYLVTVKNRSEALRCFLSETLPGESRTYPVYPVVVFTRASEVSSRGTTQGVCIEDLDSLVRLLDKFADRRRLDELHRAQVYRALKRHVASRGKRLIPAIGT